MLFTRTQDLKAIEEAEAANFENKSFDVLDSDADMLVMGRHPMHQKLDDLVSARQSQQTLPLPRKMHMCS